MSCKKWPLGSKHPPPSCITCLLPCQVSSPGEEGTCSAGAADRKDLKLPILVSLSRGALACLGQRLKRGPKRGYVCPRILLCSARDVSLLTEKEAGSLLLRDLGKITRAPLETEKQCVLSIKCQVTKKHKLPVLCGASLLYLAHVHSGAVKGFLKHRSLGPTHISDSAVLAGNPKSVHFQQVPST